MSISIAVVDDHEFSIRGISAACSIVDGVEFGWGVQRLAQVRSRFEEQAVDLVVFDLQFREGPSGFAGIQELGLHDLNCKKFVLSAHCSIHLVQQAAKLGFHGFYEKSTPVEEFMSGIKDCCAEVKKGRFYGPFEDWTQDDMLLKLSPREIDVLTQVGRGHSNDLIAQKLGLKVGTVKTHVESIFKKLSVNSRTDAVRVALTERYFYIQDIIRPSDSED